MNRAENSSELSGSSRVWHQHQELLFALGVAAWVTALLLRWPTALSFGDEVGYLGQAKLFLEGRVRPAPYSPGIWNPTPIGAVAQYPLLVSVLIAPLFALFPSAIFLSGTLAAVALAWTASRVLKSWGHSPCWGLIFLVHPTVVVLARTVMSDLLWSAFAVGAWWAIRKRRGVLSTVLLAATMVTKPTGVVVAIAIIAGEVWEARLQDRVAGAQGRAAVRVLKLGTIGLVVGAVLVLCSNAAATGTIMFGYNFNKGLRPFALGYLRTSGPTYLRSLLLNPPLLLLGLLPFWRRRMWAPIFVVLGLGTLMSFYFFVDWGPGFIESLVLSQRLILPLVAFLLIGYAAVLASLVDRLRLTKIATAVLVIAPALIAFQIGSRHAVWQQPMREAREVASQWTRQLGSDELGLTYTASKAGLLFPGKTRWIVKDGPRPPVLLCVTRGNHFRDPEAFDTLEAKCDNPGYRAVKSLPNGYLLMLRDGLQPPDVGGGVP